ncbi:hypothetical protein [Thermohalobaculum sediminis]|nr:hypothetical protein [Limibaculum sediminis]
MQATQALKAHRVMEIDRSRTMLATDPMPPVEGHFSTGAVD